MRIDSKEWNREMERQRQDDKGGFGLIAWLAGLMAVGAVFIMWLLERPL